MRVLILGESGNHCLETSFEKAFIELNCEVYLFDTRKAVHEFAHFGVIGRNLHRFFPVDAWLRKANKRIAEFALKWRPDIVISFTGAEVLPGTLAFIKSTLDVKTVWYWADPLPNMSDYFRESMCITDVAATYSNASIPVLRRMGLESVIFLPFAADKDAHYMPACQNKSYRYDLSFVGSWREEREHALSVIVKRFPDLNIKISGPYWNRCKDVAVKKSASAAPLYGKDFSSLVQDSFINLNVMDTTNYPAVNMRFFEIFAAGGNQLCGGGPEMRDVFRDREHVLYFDNDDRLIEQLSFALSNKQIVEQYKFRAQELLLKDHTYTSRAKILLDSCKNV